MLTEVSVLQLKDVVVEEFCSDLLLFPLTVIWSVYLINREVVWTYPLTVYTLKEQEKAEAHYVNSPRIIPVEAAC